MHLGSIWTTGGKSLTTSTRFNFWILFSGVISFLIAEPHRLLAQDSIPWTVECTSTPWRMMTYTPFNPSENLTYNVHWGILKAGKGSIHIEGIELQQERPTYHLVMEMFTSGLAKGMYKYFEHTKTWLDRDALVTLQHFKKTRETSYQADEEIKVDATCGRYWRQLVRHDKNEKTEENQGKLTGNVQDILGYLFYLRALPLAPGFTDTVELISGEHVWPLQISIGEIQTIHVPAGTFKCYYIKPVLRGSEKIKIRDLEFWISADEQKIPVRIRMALPTGHIRADLSR